MRCVTWLVVILVTQYGCIHGDEGQQVPPKDDVVAKPPLQERDNKDKVTTDQSVSDGVLHDRITSTTSSTVDSVLSTTLPLVVGQTASQSDPLGDMIEASESVITVISESTTHQMETVTQSTPVDQLETPLKLDTYSSDAESLSLVKEAQEQKEQQELDMSLGEIIGEDLLQVMKSLPEQPSGVHGTEITDETPQTSEAPPGVMETPPEPATKKDGDVKSEEEGLTFNEWTQKVLAEAEKDKQDSTKVETSGKAVVPAVKQRKKKNYASHDCGAKVLSFNPESTNPKGILNSNKDDYMINPCKVKKWVILELCEPIQAHSVEIASLELFSSQPKMVRIYLSDRYPTKDWKVAGEQTLKDERVIQSFDMRESHDYFAKFVKLELLDHYGDEHFCPLTILRVFGVAVTDYEDESHEEVESESIEDDIPVGGDMQEDSKNLFDSARDTVMTLVKQVLNVDPEKGANGNKTGDTALTPGGDSANGTDSKDLNDTKPCPPNASIPVEKKEEPEGDPTLNSQNQPMVPEPGKTDSFSIVTILKDDEQVETGTGSDLDHFLHSNGTLLQQFVHCEWTKTLQDTLTKSRCRRISTLCQFISLILKTSSQLSFQHDPIGSSTVDQKKPMTDGPDTIHSVEVSQTLHVESSVTISSIDSEHDLDIMYTPSVADERTLIDTSTGSETLSSSTTQHTEGVKSDSSSTVPSLHPTSTVHVMTHTDSTANTPLSSTVSRETADNNMVQGHVTHTKDSSNIDPSPSSSDIGETISSLKQEPTPSLPDSWKPDTKDVMETGTQSHVETDTQAHIKMSDKIRTEFTEEKTVLSDLSTTSDKIESGQVSASISSDIAMSSVSEISVDASSTVTKVQPTQPELEPSTQPTVDVPKVIDVEGRPDIAMETQEVQKTDGKSDISTEELKNDVTSTDIKTEDTRVKMEKNLDIKIPMMSSTSRESAIMRLTNRIKVLEQNVSLSSRFLEELSKRYKKQSEDMMKLLNKTLAKLSNMTVEQEVSNKIHEDEIYAMDRRIENLTGSVYRLTHSLQTLNQQVTDRQMIATSIEIFVIVIIFLVMSRWGRKPSITPEVQKLIESMPSKPNSKLHHRRNSISGPATPSKKFAGNIDPGGILNKFPSETSLDLNIIQPSQSLLTNQRALDGVKKKKKKKQRSLDGRGSLCEVSNIGPFVIEDSSKHCGVGPSLQSDPLDKASIKRKGEIQVNLPGTVNNRKPPLSNVRKRDEETNAGSPNTGRRDKIILKGHRRQKSLPKQHYVDEEFQRKAFNESHISQPCDKLPINSTNRNGINQRPDYVPPTHTSDCQHIKTGADNSLPYTGHKPTLTKTQSLGKGKKHVIHDIHGIINGHTDKNHRDKSLDGQLWTVNGSDFKQTESIYGNVLDPIPFSDVPPTQEQLNGFIEYKDDIYNGEHYYDSHQTVLYRDTSPAPTIKEDTSYLGSDPLIYTSAIECDDITDKDNGQLEDSDDPVVGGKGLTKFWGLFK